MSKRGRGDTWVTLIGVAKMIKCALLVAVGIAALALIHRNAADELRHLAFAIGLDPGGHLMRRLLERAGMLDAVRLREISAVTFAYAALFALEGTGLLLHKRWGEWVTIVISGSFIPLEIYETVRHPHVLRGLTIALNVAAVAYLVYRVRSKRAEGVSDSSAASPAPPPHTDSRLLRRSRPAGTGSAAPATSRRA